MIADRADLRGLLADDNMATVRALPHHVAFAREDQAFLDVFQKLTVAFLVFLLDFGHQFEEHGDFCEAFLAGGLGLSRMRRGLTSPTRRLRLILRLGLRGSRSA